MLEPHSVYQQLLAVADGLLGMKDYDAALQQTTTNEENLRKFQAVRQTLLGTWNFLNTPEQAERPFLACNACAWTRSDSNGGLYSFAPPPTTGRARIRAFRTADLNSEQMLGVSAAQPRNWPAGQIIDRQLLLTENFFRDDLPGDARGIVALVRSGPQEDARLADWAFHRARWFLHEVGRTSCELH